MHNPIQDLTKKEWLLWLGSLLIVILFQSGIRQCGRSDTGCRLCGHYFADLCRKGKRLGTDSDDRVQHSVRHHFVAVPLLG